MAALGIAAGAWISTHPELLLDQSGWPWMAVLVGAAILGMPIYALIGGAAVILFLVQGDSPANAIIGSYDQLTSNDLPAIPLFTLAGFLLAEGQASDRLLRFFRAFFGWAPGGTAVVTAMSVRVLHAPDRRIGRDDPRARRTAACRRCSPTATASGSRSACSRPPARSACSSRLRFR